MNSFLLCVALFPVIGIVGFALFKLFPDLFRKQDASAKVYFVEGVPQALPEKIIATMRDDFDTSNPVNGWYVSTNPMFREEILFDRWDTK